MCRADSEVSCDWVCTSVLQLSLSWSRTKFLDKLPKCCEHLWHYVLSLLFLGRWRAGNQPPSRIHPAHTKDIALVWEP